MSIAVSWPLEGRKVRRTGRDNKTVITSKRASFDYKRSIAVFTGDVNIVDPEVRIKSDKLTVIFDGSNDVSSVTAVGNVDLWQGIRKASCDKAIYIAHEGEIIMTGGVRVNDGKDLVSGKIVHLWINEEKMTVEPGRLVIYSQGDKKY
ncbi:MAG: hypothetical protein KAH23_02645 [Kiritimatiellae bacterium]|nr:hypothetical protein [Kiritimatiellia bacterium]